jgi:hypothetical protein
MPAPLAKGEFLGDRCNGRTNSIWRDSIAAAQGVFKLPEACLFVKLS